MAKTIPLLFLLLALPAAPPRVSRVHVAAITDASRSTGSIQTLPPRDVAAAVEAAHRLLPDRRFLLAVSDIYALRTGISAPAVVRFGSSVWEVTCDGKRVGALPLLPAFTDGMAMLTAWAHSLPVANDAKPIDYAQIDRLTNAFDCQSLFKAMQLLPDAPIGGRAAARAARAAVYLNLQLTDAFELADRLRARAAALLAIGRADDPHFGDEELALLAVTLRYDVEAQTIASKLPPGSAAQVAAGLTAATPSMLKSSALLASVAAATLIRSRANDDAIAALDKRFPNVTLPLLLGVYDSDRRVEAAKFVQQVLAKDVAGFVPGEANVAFEDSLDSYSHKHASPMLDGSLVRMFEQALFYSAVDHEFAYYFSDLADRTASEDFVRSLGEASAQPAHDVRAVLMATNDVTWNAARGVPASLATTLTSVGAGTRAQLLMRANDSAGRSAVGDATLICAGLDTRPAQIAAAARIAARGALDPARRDLWFRAILERAPNMVAGGERAWFYSLTGEVSALRQLASDRRFSADDRAVALEYLDEGGDTEFALTEFEKLEEETSYSSYAAYAGLLNNHREWKRKEAAARRALSLPVNQEGIPGAYYASSLADALEEQGRYDEAWAVIEPRIDVWSANIISGAISVLQRRGLIAESDALARRYLERYPSAASRMRYAVVLWRQRRWDDAAKLFDPRVSANDESEWSRVAPEAFERNIGDAATALNAFAALKRAGVSERMLDAIPRGIAKKQPSIALALMQTMRAPDREYDGYAAEADIAEYDLRKAGGDAGAIDWLRAQTPDDALHYVMLQLLRAGRYDEVLKVAENRPTRETDERCLYLGIALIGVRAAADDPRLLAARRLLEAQPLVTSPDSPQTAARFALGLIDEETASKGATTAKARSIIDFIIGLRLAAAGNYDGALPHVLASAQRSRLLTTPQALAIDLLTRWLSASASWPEVARRRVL